MDPSRFGLRTLGGAQDAAASSLIPENAAAAFRCARLLERVWAFIVSLSPMSFLRESATGPERPSLNPETGLVRPRQAPLWREFLESSATGPDQD